jgi:hypothetical protein
MARITDQVTVTFTHVELSERDMATVTSALHFVSLVGAGANPIPDFESEEYARVLRDLGGYHRGA